MFCNPNEITEEFKALYASGREEAIPVPQLDDPTARARGFADALVGAVEAQQKRIAAAEDEVARYRLHDTCIRNIIFNVEQNPTRHTVPEMLENMRRAIGVKPDERV